MTEVLTRHFESWREGKQLNWWVDGVDGAVNVQFMFLPNLPDMEEHAAVLGWVRTDAGWLMGSDVGYHHRSLMEDWYHTEDCPILHDPCWYDGSSLAAEEVLQAWKEAGFDDEVIYRFCEKRYREEFG